MIGFLFDENLPNDIRLSTTKTVIHVSDLGKSLSDSDIWEYAIAHDLVIVTKDADFSNRILVSTPPPKVVHLRIGNLKKKHFNNLVAKTWSEIESLINDNRLVNVYSDMIVGIK